MSEPPSSDQTPPDSKASVAESKSDLERIKLELEIRALKSPFLNNPAHWISTGTALLAITALFFQYRLSRHEFILAETKSVQAKIDTVKAEDSIKRLSAEVQRLEGEIAAKSKRRDELEALVRNADSLLGRAQGTADAKLRSEIETLRETTKPSSTFWSSLPDLVNSPEVKEAASVEKALRAGSDQINRARSQIHAKSLASFSTSQTGFNIDPRKRLLENELAFVRPGYQRPTSYTKYRIRIAGSELLFFYLDGTTETLFYRTSAATPVFHPDFDEAVRRSLEPQLAMELKRSD